MSELWLTIKLFMPPNEPGDPWLCGLYRADRCVAIGEGADEEAAEADAWRKLNDADQVSDD